jgi:phospholipid transport system substrate-binding protein
MFSKLALRAAFTSYLILLPPAAQAGGPTEQLRATLAEFLTILNNTPVPELRATGLPETALKLVFARFDFSEMTKRSLGRHWKSLCPSDQQEFVDALTQRLLIAYGRSVRSSGDDKIEFKREAQKGNQASVETRIVRSEGGELSIDYRLHDVNGQWKVYDVSIDHVSLVSNFRAQFERVIAKSSIKELLKKVKE